MPDVPEKVTLDQFREFCQNELDAAIARGEAEQHESGITYETPSGYEISRYAGMLTVKVDTGDETHDIPETSTTFEWIDGVPRIYIDDDSRAFHNRHTVALSAHDEFATFHAKYVSMVP